MGLAIVGSTILIAIHLFKRHGSRTDGKSQSEEAMMIQKIYQGLSVLEKRIGALETILIEDEGKGKKHETT